MARVRYTVPIERSGYRPYGDTNPAAAAAGVGGRVGSPGGLHGLGAAALDGSIVNYQGTWPAVAENGSGGVFAGPDAILSTVVSLLNAEGFIVLNSQSNGSAGNWLSFNPFQVTLQLQINTGEGGFGNASDVASIVNHAVYVVTGEMPINGSSTLGQGPAAATTSPITPPAVAASAANQAGSNPSNAPNLTTWFENNALLIGLGIAAIVLVEHFV